GRTTRPTATSATPATAWPGGGSTGSTTRRTSLGSTDVEPKARFHLCGVAAERALLDERRTLTREEALAVARLPLDELPALIALAHKVRLAWCGPEVELESLINAKSGACPEDCAFCSQSVRFSTGVDVYAFLDLDEVLGAARATRDAGATQFCIVVAVRGPEERLLRKVIEAVDAVHRETGLEVACSLGLLQPEQARRLAAAG